MTEPTEPHDISDIVTPAVDPGLTGPPPASTNGAGPASSGSAIPPVSPQSVRIDPFTKLEGEVGLIFRELGEITATVQATRLLMLAGLGAITLALVLVIKANAAAGAGAAVAP